MGLGTNKEKDRINQVLDLLPKLTDKEFEVLRMRCGKASNQEIAKKLSITEKTVKVHIGNILEKLKLKKRFGNYRREFSEIIFPALKLYDGEDLGTNGGNSMAKKGNRTVSIKSFVFGIFLGFILIASIFVFLVIPYLLSPNEEAPLEAKEVTREVTQVVTQEVTRLVTVEVTVESVITQPPIIHTQIVTTTPIPTPTLQPTTILFEDNFDAGLSGEWQIGLGKPLVVNNQLSSDQETWLSIGDDSWVNYKVEFNAQYGRCWFYNNNISNVIGVRFQDIDNMIALVWANCEYEVYIVQNGVWQKLPGYTSDTGSANGIIFKIIVEGDKVAIYFDGSLQVSFYDSTFPQGGIGLRLMSNVFIDNFTVETISE